MVAGGEWEGVRFLVSLGFSLLSSFQANKKAAGSGSTSFLPRSTPLQAYGGSKAEGWSCVGGGSYASTFWPHPWRDVASAAVAPTMPPLFPSFNKALVLLLDPSIWDRLKIFMEEQLMSPWQPFKPPSPGLVFFLNMPSKPQVRAVKNMFLACMQRSPACVVLQLEIRPRSGQSPCRSEGGLLVRNCLDYMPSDGRLRRKCLIKSMVLQVQNLHIRNRESFPIPCFSAQFTAYAHQCGDDVFAQLIVIWSDAWCCNCHQLLINLTSDGATSLLMISSNWYAKLNFLRVMPLEILDIYFRPMVIAAQGWQYQNWNSFPSVSLWIQVNILATVLSHQLRSHKMNDLHEQQRFWNCVYVCSTINRGGTSPSYEQDCLFMNSKGTWFFLPDGLLVDDAVLSPFGLFHQRWTTTSLSLIPRFNGGDPLRLSSVMVHQYLQLNPPKPRVHTPDRPSGEPPAGHQLVWSTMEALEDCRCSNIESVLSADDRSLFGSIGNLRCHRQVFRSSLFVYVRLGTFHPCSTLSRRDMLYS